MRPSHREWVTDGYNARSWCVCVLQLLAAGLALLIKVTGNGLAWMLLALSLSPVIINSNLKFSHCSILGLAQK